MTKKSFCLGCSSVECILEYEKRNCSELQWIAVNCIDCSFYTHPFLAKKYLQAKNDPLVIFPIPASHSAAMDPGTIPLAPKPSRCNTPSKQKGMSRPKMAPTPSPTRPFQKIVLLLCFRFISSSVCGIICSRSIMSRFKFVRSLREKKSKVPPSLKNQNANLEFRRPKIFANNAILT